MSMSTGAELRIGRGYTLKEAIKRVYLVKAGATSGVVTFPKILIGKRIRIELAEE